MSVLDRGVLRPESNKKSLSSSFRFARSELNSHTDRDTNAGNIVWLGNRALSLSLSSGVGGRLGTAGNVAVDGLGVAGIERVLARERGDSDTRDSWVWTEVEEALCRVGGMGGDKRDIPDGRVLIWAED